MKTSVALSAAGICLSALSACGGAIEDGSSPELVGNVEQAASMTDVMSDGTGSFQTFSTTGTIDGTNAFFQNLGTNGRACVSCHQPGDAWTITPAHLQARFDATNPAGTDPVFRTNDGSNSPLADVSTPAARRTAYSMLLNKGLIRVGLPIPAGAEFDLVAVADPYGYASASELSLFRRPLPTTNLSFLSTVMWDARETFKDPNSTNCIQGTTNCFASIGFDLADQANGATLGHAQAAQPLTQAQRQSIVALETSLFTAQTFDNNAQDLTAARHALGGPNNLATQAFYFGINDVVSGDYRTHSAFNNQVFNIYASWVSAPGGGVEAVRRLVAQGETLFNTKPISIAGVAGINDDLGVTVFNGTCTTCHDSPNAGDHSIPAPLDIGLTDASMRTPDMPLYTLRNLATGQTRQTTDPGRALLTGKWKDVARFKGPVLRALAARAPYFHNGSAATLNDVVNFYDGRFGIGLSSSEKSALVAFLQTL